MRDIAAISGGSMKSTLVRLLVGLVLLWPLVAFGLSPVFTPTKGERTIDIDSYFDANRLFMMVGNTGNVAYDNAMIYGRTDGLYYPYSGYSSVPGFKTVVYAAGIFMGGKVGGEIRIAAADYSSEYVPGPMADNTYQPDQPSFRVYKIDKSSGPGDPDYDQWPADQGAPVDQFGRPLLLGDQTLWAVFSDADFSHHTNNCGGTAPLGIEVQQTVWGSDIAGEQIQLYLKYKLYNKSTNPIDSFYVSFWADPDLGDASDDLIGCDTVADHFFAYNSGIDAIYDPDFPVWGGKILSGPVVPSPGDTAIFDGHPLPGYRNLRMSSFCRLINGEDPQSFKETYLSMQGYRKLGGIMKPAIDPYGHVTKYVFSGDPVTGAGWLDELPNDRRVFTTVGPMTFNPGDSQQVVIKLAAYAAPDLQTAMTELRHALDSAAVVVNPPPDFVGCDSVRVTVDDYQKLGDVYFVSDWAQRWLSGSGSGGRFFDNSAGYSYDFFGSSLDPDANQGLFHNVEIRFSQVHKQKAYRYVRGGTPNYGYGGYYEVPFTAWDTDNNRQLNVAFVENVGSPCLDHTWGPCDDGILGREYLYVLNSDYSGDNPSNNPVGYQNLNIRDDADLFDAQYFLWPALRSGHSLSEISDGQKLVFLKQTLNPNGIANELRIRNSDPDYAGLQSLVLDIHAQGDCALKLDIPSASNFYVNRRVVYVTDSALITAEISFLPPTDGCYSDILRVVDAVSGSEMAQVKLIGIPGYALEPRTEIEPNPMFYYFADAVDPVSAKIYVGNFYVTSHVLQDIDLSTLTINDSIVPTSSTILQSYPGLDGQVLETAFPIRGFINGYGLLWNYNNHRYYKLAGAFADGQTFSVSGLVIIHGRPPGDANGDNKVNIADVVYLVCYIFSDGRPPAPLQAGDLDCDGAVNVVDAVYLINYIFSGGAEPCTGR
jgi:hypothetical protein